MRLLAFMKLAEVAQITNLDSPQTSEVHRKIIKGKSFLTAVYKDFYNDLKQRLPKENNLGRVVEIGSGSGFIKEVISDVITSDVFQSTWVDKVFYADKMPFEDGSVDAFIMLNVFHHISKTSDCLREMSRCLRAKGKIIMIEPANTPWQRFVALRFHHEKFDVNTGWGLDGEGRLSVGNGALPWIVFVRDKEALRNKFPEFEVKRVSLHSPFRYIISGGLSYKTFLPCWMYPLVKGVEFILSPLNSKLALFQTIEIEKQ